MGAKYVRVKANISSEKVILSDNICYYQGEYQWVKVEPIKWLVDEERDVALANEIIFAGIQYDQQNNYHDDFNGTYIKGIMDNYLSKEIIPSSDFYLNQNQREKVLQRRG